MGMTKKWESQSRWRKKKEDAGLCSHCGGPVVPGKRACAGRLAKRRWYRRNGRMGTGTGHTSGTVERVVDAPRTLPTPEGP
jgi:hypothetical protein